MDQSKSTVNWIEAYMEWTNADSWTFGPDPLARDGFGEAGIDTGGEFAAAYLDWMDAWQPRCESNPHCGAAASAGYPDGIDDHTRGLDVLREAFMAALHTDSDRMRLLRQIIDAGDTEPRTVTPA